MDIGHDTVSFFRDDEFPLTVFVIAVIIIVLGSIVEVAWHVKEKYFVSRNAVCEAKGAEKEEFGLTSIEQRLSAQNIIRLEKKMTEFKDELTEVKKSIAKIAIMMDYKKDYMNKSV